MPSLFLFFDGVFHISILIKTRPARRSPCLIKLASICATVRWVRGNPPAREPRSFQKDPPPLTAHVTDQLTWRVADHPTVPLNTLPRSSVSRSRPNCPVGPAACARYFRASFSFPPLSAGHHCLVVHAGDGDPFGKAQSTGAAAIPPRGGPCFVQAKIKC
jgi:hypothetical protein